MRFTLLVRSSCSLTLTAALLGAVSAEVGCTSRGTSALAGGDDVPASNAYSGDGVGGGEAGSFGTPGNAYIPGVPWTSQLFSCGSWSSTRTCGPTTTAMAYSYVSGEPLGAEMAEGMVTDLGQDWPCGDYTNLSDLTSLLDSRGVAYDLRSFDAASLTTALAAHHPVIAPVYTQNHDDGTMNLDDKFGHFMLIIGSAPSRITVNDPGRSSEANGADHGFALGDFTTAWAEQSSYVGIEVIGAGDGDTDTDAGGDADTDTDTRPTEACNGLDDDGNGVVDDPGECWTAVYRLVDTSTGARCWNTTTSAPAGCAGYSYEIEAWIEPSTSVPGTWAVRQCSKSTDHILVEHGSSDETALQGAGYDCSVNLGYLYDSGSVPASTPFANACPLWRFSYDAQGGGAHLFTRGADDVSGMTCEEPARGDVATNGECFVGTPSGCG